MSHLFNCLYFAAGCILSPWLLYKSVTTGKYRRGLLSKLTGNTLSHSSAARVWFHGVSVGEVHLLRQLIAEFRRLRPDYECVVSTTTDTGLAEARKHFPDLTVFWWPLDFSWAVGRALDGVKPSLVVLAEGEMWPNFLAAAKRRGVPVAVVNGRMSPRSFGRYRLFGPLVRALLRRIDLFVMQNAEYAVNVRSLGAEPERVHVSGSIKYDGVIADRNNPKTSELRDLLGVQPDDLIWIAGSTQSPEERIALDAFLNLRERFPTLRLILVPRQRERFAEVARLLKMAAVPFSRRSALDSPRAPIILVDTIGELRSVWGLADVAFVGGSLDGNRGGQNMIEAAAYGSAVLFGPHVWNFKADAALLLKERAAVQVSDAASLEATVGRLLGDADERRRLGSAAQMLVMQQQGATAHTVELLGRLLDQTRTRNLAA